MLVVGPTLAVGSCVEVSCAVLGYGELIRALGVEPDRVERRGLRLRLSHATSDSGLGVVRGFNGLNVVPLGIVPVNCRDIEDEISRGVCPRHGFLHRDLLLRTVAAHNNGISLVAVGHLDRTARHAGNVEVAVVLVVLVEIAHHHGHGLRGGVERPAIISGRRILSHLKRVGAWLGERDVPERHRLTVVRRAVLGILIDEAVRVHMGNPRVAVLRQALRDASLVVARQLQREAVVHSVGGGSARHGLGDPDRVTHILTNGHGARIVVVHEPEGRNIVILCIGIGVVDHNLVRIGAVLGLDLGNRGHGVHSAVAVVHDLDVHTILALIVGNGRQLVPVSGNSLGHEVAERLACIILVEAHVLELGHGGNAVLGRRGVLEALVGVRQLGVRLVSVHRIGVGTSNREAELIVVHRTVEHLLRHVDATSALGTVVHRGLIGVGEHGLVSLIVTLVCVGHIRHKSTLLVVGHVDSNRADILVVGQAAAIRRLGTVSRYLVHGEGVGAHLGELQIAEVEVGRTVLHVVFVDRHCLGLHEHGHEAAAVCHRATRLGQLEVERLVVEHIAAVEGLGALDRSHAVLAERHVIRVVDVGEHEILRSDVRRRNDVRAVNIGDLRHRHLNGVLLCVVRHAILDLTVLVLGELGHLVLIGAAEVAAVKGDGSEGEVVPCVVHGLGMGRLIGARRQWNLVHAIGVRAGLQVARVVSAKRLDLKGELVGIDGVATRGVGVTLGAVDVGGATVSIVLVDEGHRVTLNRNGRAVLHAVIVGALLDGNIGNLKDARAVVRHRDNHTVESARVVDACNRIGVVVLNDAVAVLARRRKGDVAEGGRVIRGLTVHLDGGVGGLGRGDAGASRAAQAVNDKRELISGTPLTILQVLFDLERGVAAQVHVRSLIGVREDGGDIAAGFDRTSHDAVGRVVVTIGRGAVRRGEAVLVGTLLLHGELGSCRQAIDLHGVAAADGDDSAAAHRAGLLGCTVNVVRIVARESSAILVGQGNLEGEAVLILFGLVGGVTPVDRLLDLKRAGHIERQLAVVAQVLVHARARPCRVEHIGRGFRRVVGLGRRQGRGTVGTRGALRDVVGPVVATRALHGLPLGSAAVDRHAGDVLFSAPVLGLHPVGVLPVNGIDAANVLPGRLSRAVLVDVERGVLRVVVELVAGIGFEARGSGAVGRALDEAVGVEVDGLTVLGLLRAHDGGVHIARRVVQSFLRRRFQAHAVEQADRVGLRHSHGVVVGVHVVIAQRQQRRGKLHRHLVAHCRAVAALDGHHEVGEVGRAVHRVALDLAAEVVSIGVAAGGFTVTGVDGIAVGELDLVVARTRSRHLHVGTELIGESEGAGIRVALSAVVNDRRTGASVLGDRRGDVLEDLIELVGVSCREVVVGVGFALSARRAVAEGPRIVAKGTPFHIFIRRVIVVA